MSPDQPSSLHTKNRSYAIFEFSSFFFFSKRPSASNEGAKPLVFMIYDGLRCASSPSDRSSHSHVSSDNLWSLHESTMNDAILDSVPRPRARVYECVLCAVYDCECA